MRGHFYPAPPPFIGGRQPYAPALGIAQSGPVASAFQPSNSLAYQNIIRAWRVDPTTVIGLASFAPQLAPDQPPVLSRVVLNSTIRAWSVEPRPAQGRGSIAAFAPAAPVADQPPVLDRTNISVIVRGWAPPLPFAQGYGEQAAMLQTPVAPDAPPIRTYATQSLIVDLWRAQPLAAQRKINAAALIPAAALVTVPDVVGETQAQGTADLQAALFSVSVVLAYSDSFASGIIVSQLPAAGSGQVSGSNVTITVSQGPIPDALTTPLYRTVIIHARKRR